MIGDDKADDRTRAAIRAVADVPAPPVTTTLDTVIRRGRRRTLVQRGATVAAVVGVVAAIGVGGVLLRSATEGQGARPAGPSPTTGLPSTHPRPTGAPRAPVKAPPSSISLPPMALLPGWSWVAAPITPDGGDICKSAPSVSQPSDLPLPSQAEVRARLADTVRTQTGAEPAVVYQTWEAHSPKIDAPRGYVELNVDMGDGPGSVQLEVESYSGDPEEAADADVAVYGNCDPPMRTGLDSGAVLQLYQPDYVDPRMPVQHIGVYLPGGRHYIVTTAGYGESDKADLGDGTSTTNGGRGRLPLDAAGLAKVGAALAALGK